MLLKLLTIWLILINFTAIVAACSDKYAAAHKLRRIPERSLFIVAALGGAAGELLTMLIIRHKTKKPKFMLGLPAIILAQTGLVLFIRMGV